MGAKIFVDFDGTITDEDVGNRFFREFGGKRSSEIVKEYREGKISAVECFTREADAVGELTMADADRFVRAHSIDGSFHNFLTFSRNNGFDVIILSDGIDYYIHGILEENAVTGVPFFSNRAEFQTGRGGSTARLKLSFPYTDSECDRCACCKRNLMLTQTADHDVLVYVGEGYSDTCPAQFADIVFAKGDLQAFCQRQNISYFIYSTFSDVVDRLEALTLGGKQLRRRKGVELRRREVFKME